MDTDIGLNITIFITLVVSICTILFCIISGLCSSSKSASKEEIGVEVVRLLYDFGNYDELAAHQTELMQYTTEEVYNQLTFDNEERTLYTYLKFKGEACEVEILKSTSSYVLYSLNTVALMGDRKFIFLFDVTSDGKINYAREEECIDFVDYIRIDY